MIIEVLLEMSGSKKEIVLDFVLGVVKTILIIF